MTKKIDIHSNNETAVYEVSTHFNPKGTHSVMEQLKKLILSENLI